MIRSLEKRSLEDLANDPVLGRAGRRIEHVHSLGSELVPLSELRVGAMMLENRVVRELPAGGLWRETSYRSVAPAVFVLNDVLVHSSSGIVALDRFVVHESLKHTDPLRQCYVATESGIALEDASPVEIDDVCLSILAGGRNYYHWLLESIAGLATVPANYQAAARILLIPEGLPEAPRDLLGMLNLPRTMVVREVPDGETLRVRTLVLPGSPSGDFFYFHPGIAPLFRRVPTPRAGRSRGLLKRLYIDRRGSPWRRLVNEAELVAALATRGFLAIQPETLPIAAQIALFRHAEVIVGPQGAGLANLVFAQPGCKVIELLMDSYVNWSVRHLAGVFGLDHDCAIGRCLGPWFDLSPDIHAAVWAVSVMHVLAAVDLILQRSS